MKKKSEGKEEFDKIEISEEILKTLTMEDLWNSPRLRSFVEKKYPRAYLSITEPMREMGLYFFLKMADAQQKNIKEIIELNSNPDDSKKSLKYAIELIKKNGIGAGSEIWIGGVPLKFELSRFVENYANEKTFKEWRKILNDIGFPKSNTDRILTTHRRKFKID